MKNYIVWDISEKIETNNVLKNWLWDLPATTAVWSNNQIGKYIDRKWATILKDVFSATANWFWKVFFQPNEFTVLQDSYAFNFKQPVKNIRRLQMYFVSVLNKIYSKYSWENKSWWNKIKEETISLPTLSNWELAYEYMENYIKEIEAYLQSTGLSDYELSNDEKLALENFLSSNSKKFRLNELFDTKEWVYGKNKKYESIFQEEKEWTIPVISWITQNNWINYYTSDKLDESEIFQDEITISTRWEYSWTTFYHSWKFALANNILVLKLRDLNKFHKLFFVSLFNKLWYGWYDKYPTIKSLENDEIILPVNANNEINYNLIETYIKATQKIVIKDLVDNINEKLETYKEII